MSEIFSDGSILGTVLYVTASMGFIAACVLLLIDKVIK